MAKFSRSPKDLLEKDTNSSKITRGVPEGTSRAILPTPEWSKVTPVLAMDAEFVQIDGKSVIGSVSVVNEDLEAVYDVFADHGNFGTPKWAVKPPMRCLKFVCKEDLDPANGARPIEEVQKNLKLLFEGRKVVGHAVHCDIGAIGEETVDWDRVEVRDTQVLEEWQEYSKGVSGPKLGVLAEKVLGRKIQLDGHMSLEDATATMELYLLRRDAIEEQHVENPRPRPAVKTKTKKKHVSQVTGVGIVWQNSGRWFLGMEGDEGFDTSPHLANNTLPLPEQEYLERSKVDLVSQHAKAAMDLLAALQAQSKDEKFAKNLQSIIHDSRGVCRLLWYEVEGIWKQELAAREAVKLTNPEFVQKGLAVKAMLEDRVDLSALPEGLSIEQHLVEILRFILAMQARCPRMKALWKAESALMGGLKMLRKLGVGEQE
ncbi:hypothetical protein MBLNU230_g4798t1 [Neophaeotheca triangularis]